MVHNLHSLCFPRPGTNVPKKSEGKSSKSQHPNTRETLVGLELRHRFLGALTLEPCGSWSAVQRAGFRRSPEVAELARVVLDILSITILSVGPHPRLKLPLHCDRSDPTVHDDTAPCSKLYPNMSHKFSVRFVLFASGVFTPYRVAAEIRPPDARIMLTCKRRAASDW